MKIVYFCSGRGDQNDNVSVVELYMICLKLQVLAGKYRKYNNTHFFFRDSNIDNTQRIVYGLQYESGFTNL